MYFCKTTAKATTGMIMMMIATDMVQELDPNDYAFDDLLHDDFASFSGHWGAGGELYSLITRFGHLGVSYNKEVLTAEEAATYNVFWDERLTALKEANGDATHSVTGDFTIRGITKSVTFEAKVANKDGKMSIEGTAELNRAEFDVKYGSGSFFDNLGDNLIHDNFSVGFSLVATAM